MPIARKLAAAGAAGPAVFLTRSFGKHILPPASEIGFATGRKEWVRRKRGVW